MSSLKSSSYPHLSVLAFGRGLLESGDLDPIYPALLFSKLDRPQLARWLLAYWLFYHAGYASFASELAPSDYWIELAQGASAAIRPRGTERRHFRGERAIRAVKEIADQFPEPEALLDYLYPSSPTPIQEVLTRAKRLPQFGPWIAFKVADMLDATAGLSVELGEDMTPFLYAAPREAIALWTGTQQWKREPPTPEQATKWLLKELAEYPSHHKPDRPPDLFAIETVWCKWGSHMSGHYPLGKDTREIRHGLGPWVRISETAQRFAAGLPVDKERLF